MSVLHTLARLVFVVLWLTDVTIRAPAFGRADAGEATMDPPNVQRVVAIRLICDGDVADCDSSSGKPASPPGDDSMPSDWRNKFQPYKTQ